MSKITVSYKAQETSSRLWALLTIVFVKYILLIPIIIVLVAYQYLTMAVAAIGILCVLVTGKYPQKLQNIVIGFMRYQWRISAYFLCLTDTYPPFAMGKTDYPAEIDFEYQETSSRLWAALTIIPVKMILLIPHFFVLFVKQIIVMFAAFYGIIMVLIQGKYPPKVASMIRYLIQYADEIMIYMLCLTDERPKLQTSLQEPSIIDKIMN